MLFPSHGLYLQTIKVQDKFVTYGTSWRTLWHRSSPQQATQILSVKFRPTSSLNKVFLIYVGLVTTTNDLIENHHLIGKTNVDSFIDLHTTHITATVERSEISRIRYIRSYVVEHHTRHDVHGYTIHIDVELCPSISLLFTGQSHLAEVRTARRYYFTFIIYIKGILLQHIFSHHVGTVVT